MERDEHVLHLERKFRILEWPKESSMVITSYFLLSIFLLFLKIIFSWHMATLNKDCIFQSPLHIYRQVTKFWPMRYYWTLYIQLSFPLLPHSLVGDNDLQKELL